MLWPALNWASWNIWTSQVVRWPLGDSTWSNIWPGTRLHSIFDQTSKTQLQSHLTGYRLGRTQEWSEKKKKEGVENFSNDNKGSDSSSKFQNNLWQTQLYFSFIPSIILLARTSVEVPGTLQNLLEFWTPLHVYKKCPCFPRQAGISCFTSNFPSQYQSEARSLLHSQSISLSLNLSSLKSSLLSPSLAYSLTPHYCPLYSLVKDIHEPIPSCHLIS